MLLWFGNKAFSEVNFRIRFEIAMGEKEFENILEKTNF